MQGQITANDVEMVKVIGAFIVAAVGGSVAFAVKELRGAKRRREADIEERVEQALAVRKRDKRTRFLMRELRALRPIIETVEKKVSDIEYQVKPNGSGSMNDKIVAIHSEVSFEIATRRLTEHRAVSEAAVMLDGGVRMVSVSQSWTRITGLSLEAMQHDNWPRCIAPEDFDRVMKSWDASRKFGRPFHETYDVIHVENQVRTTVSHSEYPIKNTQSHKIAWWVGNLTPRYPVATNTIAFA